MDSIPKIPHPIALPCDYATEFVSGAAPLWGRLAGCVSRCGSMYRAFQPQPASLHLGLHGRPAHIRVAEVRAILVLVLHRAEL